MENQEKIEVPAEVAMQAQSMVAGVVERALREQCLTLTVQLAAAQQEIAKLKETATSVTDGD